MRCDAGQRRDQDPHRIGHGSADRVRKRAPGPSAPAGSFESPSRIPGRGSGPTPTSASSIRSPCRIGRATVRASASPRPTGSCSEAAVTSSSKARQERARASPSTSRLRGRPDRGARPARRFCVTGPDAHPGDPGERRGGPLTPGNSYRLSCRLCVPRRAEGLPPAPADHPRRPPLDRPGSARERTGRTPAAPAPSSHRAAPQ